MPGSRRGLESDSLQLGLSSEEAGREQSASHTLQTVWPSGEGSLASPEEKSSSGVEKAIPSHRDRMKAREGFNKDLVMAKLLK